MRDQIERLPDYLEVASEISREALRTAVRLAAERELDAVRLVRMLSNEMNVAIASIDEPGSEGWMEYRTLAEDDEPPPNDFR